MNLSINTKNSYFRGLIYTRIEDHGPDISYNYSNLDETQALTLVVQAFTIIGVGTGGSASRSTMLKENYVFGPLPVSNLLLNSMIFPFTINDQNSNDIRIRNEGRSCAFILLVSRQMHHYDKLRDFLMEYLGNWVNDQENLDQVTIKKIFDELKSNSLFRKTKKEAEIKGNEEEIRQLAVIQQQKIQFLRNLLSMDSFSRGLLELYESNPEGGSIDQLSKLARMSRIMIGWNIRKYAKAGILSFENNQIKFL